MSEGRRPIHPRTGRGRFITLEGGEGAGKSTQLGHIVRWLREKGIEAIATREPGGSPGAETLRQVLLSGSMASLGPAAEAILFAAARIDHIDTKIGPALAAGTFVVCDRFADSTRAYQGARGQLDPRFLRALERVSLGNLRPDLTLILDIPPAEGLARAAARRGTKDAPDRFEREDLSFHENLRAAFLEIAAAEPKRCAVIDASRAEEDVAQAIFDVISKRLLAPVPIQEVHGG
jgi:dTMP kinase